MEHAIVLISGGLDSTILALQRPEVPRVFIRYGQEYADQEERACRTLFGDTFETLTISGPPLAPGIFVPNRNLTLASVVTMFYAPDIIFIAGLRDDNVCDKTESAYADMSRVLTVFAEKPVTVSSPFWQQTKGEIVEEFLRTHDAAPLTQTYSCYRGVQGGCNNCPACFRRFVALASNGVDVPRIQSPVIQEYLRKLHTYDQNRISRTFIALKRLSPVYAIDIDGVLCQENARPYAEKVPIPDAIQRVNALEGYTVIYTARLDSDRADTVAWLQRHQVSYDALLMQKVPYSWLIDDKSRQLEDIVHVYHSENV